MERYVDESTGVSEMKLAIEQLNPVEWLCPWTAVELDENRIDHLRFGRSLEDGRPGFARIIEYEGVPRGHQAWRYLVGEEDLQKGLARLERPNQ